MKKLKIINRSGVEIQLAELVDSIRFGRIIPIPQDGEYNYPCDRYLENKSIRLDLPPGDCIHLNSDFMEAYMIAYVRKGDDDSWFVDPVRRGANLVTKHVYNSTAPNFALAEFVSKKKEETWRVPGKTDRGRWTAWWEIEMPERTKKLLIVDPVDEDRKYFGRKGGPRLVGTNAKLSVLRAQNINIDEIKVAKQFVLVEVKPNPQSGSLVLKYPSGLRFWSKLRS